MLKKSQELHFHHEDEDEENKSDNDESDNESIIEMTLDDEIILSSPKKYNDSLMFEGTIESYENMNDNDNMFVQHENKYSAVISKELIHIYNVFYIKYASFNISLNNDDEINIMSLLHDKNAHNTREQFTTSIIKKIKFNFKNKVDVNDIEMEHMNCLKQDLFFDNKDKFVYHGNSSTTFNMKNNMSISNNEIILDKLHLEIKNPSTITFTFNNKITSDVIITISYLGFLSVTSGTTSTHMNKSIFTIPTIAKELDF
jgi:hypothetical protein